jgi:hypothetical protein
MSVISIARSRFRPAAWELDAASLITGVVYLAFFAFGFAAFTDPDYFWHARTGQLIIDELAIPRHDVFSFTAHGEGWLVHEWLSEVLVYLSVSTLGYATTLGIFIAIILAAFGMMHRLMARTGTPSIVITMLMPLALLISIPFWTVRPQVFTWFLFSFLISRLFEARRADWALVPVMVLWANLHVGFMFGMGVTGLWFIARVWDWRTGEHGFDAREGALFLLALFAATWINPNGPLLYSHALPFLPGVGNAVDLNGVTEWASPDFHEPAQTTLLLGIVVLMLLTLSGRVGDRFAMMLAVTFTALSLYASRNQPLFAIAFLPAAGLAARGMPVDWLRVRGPSRPLVNWALIGVAAIVALIAIPQIPNAQVYREPLTSGRLTYPEQGLAWVEENRPQANVFATYMWGGYVLHSLYPEGHVYIDGRADMYGGETLGDYQSIVATMPGWQDQLESSGADTVLIRANTTLERALRDADGWSLVHEDDVAVVFVRDATARSQ